jgi:iron-sulfur cluster assembly accessory protein
MHSLTVNVSNGERLLDALLKSGAAVAHRVFESAGVRIAVDPASLPRVQGTTVDLVREGLARRLRFDNPNARQSCGCGESFGT